MQPKKQKKQITVFIIVGGIVLAALLLIAILWVTEDATASAYILEKIGVGSCGGFVQASDSDYRCDSYAVFDIFDVFDTGSSVQKECKGSSESGKRR